MTATNASPAKQSNGCPSEMSRPGPFFRCRGGSVAVHWNIGRNVNRALLAEIPPDEDHEMNRWLACCWMMCLVGCVSSEQGKEEDLPPDLRTRKTGSDWPGFLGPTGNSVSTEKGILAPWPKEGPRVLWKRSWQRLRHAAVTSRGRLFLFDRAATRPACAACNSEPARLWNFDYPTHTRTLRLQ